MFERSLYKLVGSTAVFASLTVACRATQPEEEQLGATRPSPEPSTRVRESAPATGGRAPKPVLSAALPKPAPAPPQIYALGRFAWIREYPDANTQWIGFLWTGGAVARKSEQGVYGPGCDNKWYAVEPRGYVCVDEKRATLNAEHATYVALKPYAPNLTSPWPHRYGESKGLPRYGTLPDTGGGDAKHESAIDMMTAPAAAREGRNRLLSGSTVAFSEEVQWGGRTWLRAADMTWVPKDQVNLYPKVTFKGVQLGTEAQLPLAFFRKDSKAKYRRSGSGRLEATTETFPRLSVVQLTGESVTEDEDTFLETKEAGVFVRQRDAVVPTPRQTTPWGAKVGAPDETGHAPKGRATWMEASVWQGWLIAYEGTTPVYATLISPGRGGTPVEGKDPVETASTPTGRFPISGKFATATMEAPGELVHSDVPWTQNFSGPHALHGAYWHDDWGNLKSGGCVNVSPQDGRWLYEFTEPEVPPGWHGVRWLPKLGPATTLVVHN